MRPQTDAHIDRLAEEQRTLSYRWYGCELMLAVMVSMPVERRAEWKQEQTAIAAELAPIEKKLARFGATFNTFHQIEWGKRK